MQACTQPQLPRSPSNCSSSTNCPSRLLQVAWHPGRADPIQAAAKTPTPRLSVQKSHSSSSVSRIVCDSGAQNKNVANAAQTVRVISSVCGRWEAAD